MEAMAAARTRSSWNDRLTHWEKPASDSEEAQIQRAATMVRNALATNPWLKAEGVSVEPQGSYFNNTNVRQTADQDLRAVHPLTKIECAPGIDRSSALGAFGFVGSPRIFEDVMTRMRREIDATLADCFGAKNLDTTGKKAVRVIELPGSRAPVDVAPMFQYVWITNGGVQGLMRSNGASILSKDGTWTNNFPTQHNANGIAKRARTLHRFKKVVRALKRLRDELEALKLIQPKQCPSFLIECLTYCVADDHFLSTAPDERHERLVRIVGQMAVLLTNSEWTKSACEINDIKYLFRTTQPWTVESACAFVVAAYNRLTA
jgi:hypothetical protein